MLHCCLSKSCTGEYSGTLLLLTLYDRNAYNLVLHKHGDMLYEGVQDTVYTRLRSVCLFTSGNISKCMFDWQVAEQVAVCPDNQLLQEVCEQWKQHQVTMIMVRDILMYMDRTLGSVSSQFLHNQYLRYVPQNKKMAVYDLGLWAFRETIARHGQVRDRLRKLLLENIRDERLGRLIDHNCMKCALYMLSELGIDSSNVYEEEFEVYFLKETCQFYRSESHLFLSQNTCPDYLKKVESRICEEMQRVPNYLHANTRPKLRHIVETELISAHTPALIESKKSGFCDLLRQSEEKMADITRMYALCFQVPATLDLLRSALHEHVRAAGQLLLNDEMKDPVVLLRSLLALREKYDSVVRNAFRGENIAQKKVKEAFESVINADTRCASSLVAYIDELMRSGLKGAAEGEVECELEKVIIIFRYLHDKDVFEVLYKQYLAKRLLNQRSISSEAERQMLVKLKRECGYQYTTKLEGMITDIRFSRGAMEKYNTHRDEKKMNEVDVKTARAASCDIDVTMLTAGYWPIHPAIPCVVPDVAASASESFKNFYLKQHTGRKLTWLTSSGTAELKAIFSDVAKHELTVSTYQMCILILFNALDFGEELTMQSITDATKIPHNDLKRHLISLCTPKYRILLKRSKGKGFSSNDKLRVNNSFASKLRRVRVPLVAMKELSTHPNSSHSVPAAIEEDRRHLCEATVVRIMKARKQAQHNDLIAEVNYFI